MVRYGRTVEEGFLPVYSVETEQEARQLLVAACSRDMAGNFIARELVDHQTLDNLYAFSDRLAETHKRMKKTAKDRSKK